MKLDKSNKLKIGLAAAVAILLAKLFVIQIVDERYKIEYSYCPCIQQSSAA